MSMTVRKMQRTLGSHRTELAFVLERLEFHKRRAKVAETKTKQLANENKRLRKQVSQLRRRKRASS